MTKVKQKDATQHKVCLRNLLGWMLLMLTLVVATTANAESVLLFQAGNDTLNMAAEDVLLAQANISRTPLISVQIGLVPTKAKLVLEFTGHHVGKQMKLIVCNRLLAEPTIIQPISGDNMQLFGDFTEQEAKEIARQLKSPSCGPVSFLEKTAPAVEKSSLRG